MMKFVFVVLLSFLAVSFSKFVFDSKRDNNKAFSAVCTGRLCSITEGISKGAHAYVTYDDESIYTEGWGKLWSHGDETDEGWFQAGFLEGALTSKRIFQHFKSWMQYTFGASPPTPEVIQFMIDQFQYSANLVKSNRGDSYYNRLGNINTLMEGILSGQNYGAANDEEKLSFTDILLLEAAGDLYDIIPAVTPSNFKLRVGNLTHEEFFDEWHKVISCSALIKITDDLKDVYAAHTTWTSYQNMLRVYKNYNLGGGQLLSSFSSKPGVVYSKDDFYALPREDQRMVVMETTNGVMNSDLYKLVTPQSLLTWQRIPMANSLTNNGADWTSTLARHNSGTYANQWIVLDMKKFVPGQGVPSGKDLVWIIEVAPGIASRMDVTDVMLKQGNYWPSYNVPYLEDVYEASGFQAAYNTYGNQYSYTQCPRATIMTRDHSNVQDMSSMQYFIRYNKFQTDPLSLGSSGNAISSRTDLRASNPRTYGSIDGKISSYSRLMTSEGQRLGLSSAQSGPTHDDQAVFQWSGTSWDQTQIHLGQPDKFDFPFVDMKFRQN